MNFKTNIERYIFKAISGYSIKKPQKITGIIAHIDSSERFIISHDELVSGLEKLIDVGYIAETDSNNFFDSTNKDYQSKFSGITEADYASAVDDYKGYFQEQLNIMNKDTDDDFQNKKLIIYLTTPNVRWPIDDDEDMATELATIIDPVISQSGLGEINGFEYGEGAIEIVIFGKEGDFVTDQLYKLVAPKFQLFSCLAGSHIVKFYNTHDKEVKSDIR